MDIRVKNNLSFHPHHPWSSRSVDLDGHLSDGRHVDLSTVDDPAHCVTGEQRYLATDAWLHGQVLVLDEAGAPPRVIVPIPQMSAAVVGEALRRWLVSAA